MKLLLNGIKAALLAGALAILALSAIPRTSGATDIEVGGDDCAGSGHTCHFVADGVVFHAIKQNAN